MIPKSKQDLLGRILRVRWASKHRACKAIKLISVPVAKQLEFQLPYHVSAQSTKETADLFQGFFPSPENPPATREGSP